jgi:predicted membrane-bound mannosyltransferase
VTTVAAAVAAMFFSSFLTAPAAVFEPFRAIGTYLGRGVDPTFHAQPWSYYLGLLAFSSSGGLWWTEGFVLVLAIVGLGAALRPHDPADPARAFWARHLAGYALVTAVAFSAIRYKTPWNLLPFYAAVIVIAGIGFSSLVHSASSRAARGALVAILLLASGHLGWQAWRASVTWAADPRNPYVYAQTVPDAVRMATRIRGLASVHPDGERMQVSVVAPPYEQWPLPWYLRGMPHVGYWTAAGDATAMSAPVVVASLEHAAGLDATLGDRYVSEFYGLRPDVLLALYVERSLWERFLARAADSGSASAGAGGRPWSTFTAGRSPRLGVPRPPCHEPPGQVEKTISDTLRGT